MTIEEIKNKYAVLKGYNDYYHLLMSIFTYHGYKDGVDTVIYNENEVIKLIQYELKNEFIEKLNNFHNKEIAGSDLDHESYKIVSDKLIKFKNSIINTENIK